MGTSDLCIWNFHVASSVHMSSDKHVYISFKFLSYLGLYEQLFLFIKKNIICINLNNSN
jgi:hypothetical protein